ncbi:hypothetical protein Tco_0567448 [Tanacetum coccineum]
MSQCIILKKLKREIWILMNLKTFVLSRRTCGKKDGGHGTKDLRKKDSDGGDENRDAEIDSSENDEDLWEPMQWRSPSKLNEGEDSKEKTPSGGDQSDEKDYNKLINAEENDTDDDQSDKDSDEESNRNGGRDDDASEKDSNGGDENIYTKPDLVNKLNDDGLWEVYEQYDAKGSSSKLNEGEYSKEKIHSGGDQSDEKDYNKLINAEENDADDDQSDKDSDEESKSSGNTKMGYRKSMGVGVVYPKINPFPSALRELVISTYHGMPHEPSHADDGESKTYFMYGASNEHVAVFKSMDGEAKGFVVPRVGSGKELLEVRDVIIYHFSVDEVHKIAMLDIRFENADGHLDNILRHSRQDGLCVS